MARSIPLYVRSFENPEQEGTTVFSYQTIKYPAIRLVLDQQTLLILSTLDFSFVVENHLSEVFSKAVNHKIRINLLKNLALSLSLVVGRNFEHLEAFIEDLKNTFQVERIDDVQLFTIRHYTVPELVSAKHSRKIYIEEYDTNIAQLVLGRSE
jgi:aspartate kinase